MYRKTINVLWVSRHEPLPAQIRELKLKLGGKVKIKKLEGTVPNAEFVVKLAKEVKAKYIVPVLPLSITARLAELCREKRITILLPRMENILTTKNMAEAEEKVRENSEARAMVKYADGTIRVYEFKGFEKLVRVVLETVPLR